MNIRNTLAAALILSAAAAPVFAGDAATGTVRIVVDCAHVTLPSQSQVGELLGLSNFSQIYAARAALVSEAQGACMRSHARQVALIRAVPAGKDIQLAANAPRGN